MAALRIDPGYRPSLEGASDDELYPDRGRTAMPSVAHGRACLVVNDSLVTELEPESLVAIELSVYPVRDDPKTFLVPDLLVALGAGQADPRSGELRTVYRMWDEGGPPDLVLELASRSTVGRDKAGKKEDYAAYGVREYVQFDPLGTLLVPNLQVWTLDGDRYTGVAARSGGGFPSAVLPGLEWVQLGQLVRLRDIATGALLPTAAEVEAARAEGEAARAEAESARAEAEAARAEAESARAEAETARADTAEAALALLQAEIARLRGA